ncbi:ATP-binding cassette sub-family A member 2 [Manis javanica]|nr:ATP-binding cassette sub-family A member 2 [Manis javanica]
MKIIYGAVKPDEGRIEVDGKPVHIRNPQEARQLGIAMVFQHFSLFDTLSVAENVWLGLDEEPAAGRGGGEALRRAAPPGVRRLLHPLHQPQAARDPFAGTACTVLRGGQVTGVCNPAVESNASLSRLMIGSEPPEPRTANPRTRCAACRPFFWDPVKSTYALGELAVKATPLLLIARGLAVCFRSNVWNIGAEGQFVIGAVAAGGVALLADKTTGPWIVPAILVAGMLGGMVWAGIVALLRDRFNANEILVSLMLVYVATLVLGFLVYGPWKDPMGYNFPQTKTFERVTQIPKLMQGMRTNIGLLLALAAAAMLWVFLFRTRPGFALQVGGLAPAAARYAGFSSRRALWRAC